MDRKTTVPQFKAGDLVRIRDSSVKRAKIVELRGPLGPGGTQVYRIRVSRKPKPFYVEVMEDQMVRLPVST
jgi:hypothetical protein